MPSINKVILAGNVTRDPEITFTPRGTPKCQIGLAINERWKDANGEPKEEVTFVDCVIWGKRGESAGKYVTKGTALMVEGKLRREQWEDKTGQKRSATRVVVDDWQFLGPKRDSDGSTSPRPERAAPSRRETLDDVFTPEGADDDIPY